MKFIADFHIHSKYSRATSKEMDLTHLSAWAKSEKFNAKIIMTNNIKKRKIRMIYSPFLYSLYYLLLFSPRINITTSNVYSQLFFCVKSVVYSAKSIGKVEIMKSKSPHPNISYLHVRSKLWFDWPDTHKLVTKPTLEVKYYAFGLKCPRPPRLACPP